VSTVDDALGEAQATEDALRAQLGDLIGTKVRAEHEAERLDTRAGLPGADPELAALAGRHRAQAARLAAEVEEVRHSLRAQEARTEALRADAAGA
jgi:hypothetical protein